MLNVTFSPPQDGEILAVDVDFFGGTYIVAFNPNKDRLDIKPLLMMYDGGFFYWLDTETNIKAFGGFSDAVELLRYTNEDMKMTCAVCEGTFEYVQFIQFCLAN